MKRTSRVTADITLDAHNLLRDACLKFDSSKGKLLERMIRNFCGGDAGQVKAETVETAQGGMGKVETPKTKRTVFTPPTFSEIDAYMITKGLNDNSEADKFRDFYESNGWKVGKNKMKCWKAAARNWIKNSKGKPSNVAKQFSQTTEQNINTIGEWLNE